MTLRYPLAVGDPAPWFSLGTRSFDEMAGRHIVLFFFGNAGGSEVLQALTEFERRTDLFDDERASFLGVGRDTGLRESRGVRLQAGLHYFADLDGAVAALYGVGPGTTPGATVPIAFVLSPMLQIVEIVSWHESSATWTRHVASLLSKHLETAPDASGAPVLTVPHVFDLDLCRKLIDLYAVKGGVETGFGDAVTLDRTFKQRRDCPIVDPDARRTITEALQRRLLMSVYRTFQFGTTRIERFLVACYDSATGGYFRPHRDNVTPATAHRRFALTVNLNDDYEGGDLRFLEFGRRMHRPPVGGAIVFSCSLLHEVVPVTRGRRYAFLSFFFDEPSARLLDEQVRRGVVSKG